MLSDGTAVGSQVFCIFDLRCHLGAACGGSVTEFEIANWGMGTARDGGQPLQRSGGWNMKIVEHLPWKWESFHLALTARLRVWYSIPSWLVQLR
jgi:hypothetical protein